MKSCFCQLSHWNFRVIIFIIVFGNSFCHANIWPDYYASRGTLPQEQGWRIYDVNEPSEPFMSNNLLNLGPTSDIGTQGWYDDSRIFCFDEGDRFYISFRMKVIQSDYEETADNTWQTGFEVWAYDNAGRFVSFGIASDGVRITNSSDASTASSHSMAFYPFDTTDGFHNYAMRIVDGKIYFRFDYGQYLTLLDIGNIDQGDTNIVGFGDFSAYAQSQIQFESLGYYGNYGSGLLAPEGYIVDIDDLFIFIENWLRIDCTCPDFCEGADINQDGRVDLIDFSVICEQWLEYLGPS